MGNNTQSNEFNNLITTGFGFLNDFKFIQGQNGEFAVVTCALLVGRKDEQRKTYINCVVTDAVADLLDEVWDEDLTTTAAVKISDIYADAYLHQGKPGANLKGKLIKLDFLKIGDDIIELDEEEESPLQHRSQSKSQPRKTQQRKSQGYQGRGKQRSQRSQRSTTTRNESGRTRRRRAA